MAIFLWDSSINKSTLTGWLGVWLCPCSRPSATHHKYGAACAWERIRASEPRYSLRWLMGWAASMRGHRTLRLVDALGLSIRANACVIGRSMGVPAAAKKLPTPPSRLTTDIVESTSPTADIVEITPSTADIVESTSPHSPLLPTTLTVACHIACRRNTILAPTLRKYTDPSRCCFELSRVGCCKPS